MSTKVANCAIGPGTAIVLAGVTTDVFLIGVWIGAFNRDRCMGRIVWHGLIFPGMNPHVDFIRTDGMVYISGN